MLTWFLFPRAARKMHTYPLDGCPGRKQKANFTFSGNHVLQQRQCGKKAHWTQGLTEFEAYFFLLTGCFPVPKCLGPWIAGLSPPGLPQ